MGSTAEGMAYCKNIMVHSVLRRGFVESHGDAAAPADGPGLPKTLPKRLRYVFNEGCTGSSLRGRVLLRDFGEVLGTTVEKGEESDGATRGWAIWDGGAEQPKSYHGANVPRE